MFNRTLTIRLNEWKTSLNRKPLVLRGARQVGKTTLVKQFAKTYKEHIILNLEKSDDVKKHEPSERFEMTEPLPYSIRIVPFPKQLSPSLVIPLTMMSYSPVLSDVKKLIVVSLLDIDISGLQ